MLLKTLPGEIIVTATFHSVTVSVNSKDEWFNHGMHFFYLSMTSTCFLILHFLAVKSQKIWCINVRAWCKINMNIQNYNYFLLQPHCRKWPIFCCDDNAQKLQKFSATIAKINHPIAAHLEKTYYHPVILDIVFFRIHSVWRCNVSLYLE